MAVVTVPKVLREKLSEEGADALVELINKADEKEKQDVIALVEEKFERRLAETRAALEVKIEASKAELIRWMFIFWVGQIAVTTGILVTLLRK